MAIFQFILLLVGISIGASNALPEFDFEDSSQIAFFDAGGKPNHSQRSIVSGYSKSGQESLLWQWGRKSKPDDENPSLTLKLNAQTTIKGKELRNGGIKFWMYRTKETPASKMNIVFQNYDESHQRVTKKTPAVQVNLDFKGWRAVWIGYKEFGLQSTTLKQLNRVQFAITTDNEDKLYIDVFRFVGKIGKQTRDKVVPEVPMIGISSPQNYETHPLFYDEKDYWQQSLRWDKYTQHCTPEKNVVPDAGLTDKSDEICKIEERLDEWYAKTTESVTYLTTTDDCEKFKKHRWDSLQNSIKQGHDLYAKLSKVNINNVMIINRPALFSSRSELGEDKISDPPDKTKFGYIFTKILFPLSLEYYLMNRDVEVTSLSDKECQNLKKFKKGDPQFDKAIENIAGNDSKMRDEFEIMVDPTLIDCTSQAKVKDLIKKFNKNVRFGRILRLLKYVENQGWAAGSGLGTLAHEMNKAGAGFMHSMFLLRHELRENHADMFKRLLKTMKWYNDFNEIYQPADQYSYDGTSADRMRTIILYRLMIILIPERPQLTKNKDTFSKREIKILKQTVYGMNCFKSWFENTLKINKGLGGVIKPDYTGFHHMTFYGSAYVPQALHNAAFVKYLLGDETNFALDSTSSENLQKALALLRIVAVKYSTPNGICGRFSQYQKSILSEHFPAYAYMSYVHKTPDLHQEDAGIFLRLFDVTGPAKKHLSNGKVDSSIYYLNSIGSIDFLFKVKSLAVDKGISKEASPSGHWSKNFAALSTHRRGDWSVAAKGFSKYTWDFENSKTENLFGVFQSYGSLQISNSEDALRKYDVTKGWDWTKVPGATTVNIEYLPTKNNDDKTRFHSLITDKARYYSPDGGFAGGVSLGGKNGVFGMNLKKLPHYQTKFNSSPLATMDFSFRKTYFFYDHLIVCVGDGITLTDAPGYLAQTTLFQDKRLNSATDNIKIDATHHDLNAKYKNNTWSLSPPKVTLKDTSGNTYVVKKPHQSKLNVKISDQDSKTSDDKKDTKGRYATAWLEHSPAYNHYEYAILIKGGRKDLLQKYTVIKKEGVHSVEVDDKGEKTVGYTFFQENQRLPRNSMGPVEHVNKPCLIMTSEKGSQLYFAISDPSINFKDVPKPEKQTCHIKSRKDFENGKPKTNYLDPTNLEDVRAKLLFCVEGKKNEITVTLKKNVKRVINVKVNGEDKTSEKDTYVTFDVNKPRELTFLNLLNGFTTELELET